MIIAQISDTHITARSSDDQAGARRAQTDYRNMVQELETPTGS